MAAVSHVLVLSIGNPAPYLNTLHSAGHVAIEALRRELMLPPFAKSRQYGGKAVLMAAGAGPGDGGIPTRYTLVQSPTLMNVSGPWVSRVWRDVVGAGAGKDDKENEKENEKENPKASTGLVIVHDELESTFGQVRHRPLSRSHRGHNGLKSIKTSLQPLEFPGAPWSMLSVGIGRPDERDKGSVASFVMRAMSSEQRSVLENDLGPGLLATLRQIEAQWAAGPEQPQPPKKKTKTRPNARQP